MKNKRIIISNCPANSTRDIFNQIPGNFDLLIYKLQQKGEFIETLSNFLLKNGPIISTTDTIPGFLALFDKKAALEKIYRIKQRDPKKQFLLIVNNISMALAFCPKDWLKENVKSFCQRVWPGPVTLILPLEKKYRSKFCQLYENCNSYAVRIPENTWLRDLISQCQKALVAPSANISNEPVPGDPLSLIQVFEKEISTFHFPYEDFLVKNPYSEQNRSRNNRPSILINMQKGYPEIIREGSIPNGVIQKIWQESKSIK